jgi:hypothetical protein
MGSSSGSTASVLALKDNIFSNDEGPKIIRELPATDERDWGVAMMLVNDELAVSKDQCSQPQRLSTDGV